MYYAVSVLDTFPLVISVKCRRKLSFYDIVTLCHATDRINSL